MKILYNEGLLMCREYSNCEFVKCKHFTWHEERGGCKPRECSKTGMIVSCTKNPLGS